MSWIEKLKVTGKYYSGFVEDLDRVLELYRIDTVSTYGTRTSRKNKTMMEGDTQTNEVYEIEI